MKFPESFLEEVKGRFRLSEYVGRSVQLKRSGREFVGLSPFGKEKTPSFYVNDDKAFFFDFSSGKTGDIVTWVIEHEGKSFVEAVEQLAGIAGVPLPERDARSADVDRRQSALRDVLQAADNYFQDRLRDASGREAREYLERRGIPESDWARFGIGYAPDSSSALAQALKHLSADNLVSSGVLIRPDDGRAPYDRYRHRLMFPIRDASGRLVSFGGRALGDAKAKYLNGPDTELFDKSKHLYGLDMARKLLAAGPGPLVVVEGYMDVVACQRAGVAACATMGTSLTIQQIEMMWRFHPEPTLCFDSDAAGRRAAARAQDQVLPKIGAARSLAFCLVTGGKDPDDIMRERGPEALRSQLLKVTPLAEAIFQREHAALPLDTPERRADLRERLRKVVRAISDRDLVREYSDLFKLRLESLRQNPAQAPASATGIEAAQSLRTSATPVVSGLAYWLVKDPGRALDDLERLDLGHPPFAPLVECIVSWLMENEPDAEELAQHLYVQGLAPVVAQLSDPGGRLKDPEAWRKVFRARRDYVALEAAVQQAKAEMTTPAQMQKFLALKAQRDQAKRAL